MSNISNIRQAANPQQQQEILLVLCFQHLAKGLYNLAQKLGGSEVGDQLETLFNDIAQSKGYPFRMYTDDIRGLDNSVNWLVYRELIGEIINFTVAASDKATVKKFIQAILEQIEEETDSNLHEVKYRLALDEYIQ